MSPLIASETGGLLRRPMGAVTRLYSNRLIVMVAVFGVLAVLGLTAVLLVSMRNSRLMALQAAEHSSHTIAQAVTGSVARTVQSVDVLLLATATQFEENSWPANPADADGQLRRLLAFMPHIRQLALIAADGRILGDSGDRRLTAQWDARPYFAQADSGLRGTLIGTRQPGRMLGPAGAPHIHHFIPFFRVLKSRSGQGDALLVAAVNPLHFNDMFTSLDLPPSARLRMWRYDGTLLAGDEDDGGFAAADHAGDTLFAEQLKKSEFGTFLLTDTDGTERITSYRTTANWPVVISVGLSRDDVLSLWRDASLPLLWPVGGLGLGLLVLTAILTRSLILRARTEATLVLSEQVLQTVSNGVAIADATQPDFPLVYVNPAFESMTGYKAADVVGTNARFLHRDDYDQPDLARLRTALETGGSVHVVLRNYRADGSLFWNDMTVSAVHAITGGLTHFVAIQRDITEQEQNRVSLRQAYDRIERYSAELERFSFILAHHLQEPARHIVLYSQMISRALDENADLELRGNLDFLTRAGSRLKDLLRDVQLYLAMDRLAMVGGNAEAEMVLDKEWVNRSVGIDGAEMSSSALPRVQVPPRRLADLFAVLIDNSILFRHPDRPLRVTVEARRQDDGFWRFDFSDNGMGIPPEFLEKVFGVFERLHGREQFRGNGVGLAIARKLVETLGGRISAHSDGVSGTTLTFTLPEATE
ncbi:putative Signal transduction histidine kinase [Magnetospirillum gryphiswaldense MSR-1 v2]|uniref:histidine kinase n=1 Tax=Magnetospirillum gryphiswaldense (strain DSM 6361 / JCM 21280 / NBRC 15271 / MSR-1) TaxID=431944 RepID=V6EZ67_MAGGM|nr:putative Signal transduction histidine kinase [Magnetospirillum gryphiswaldense MSR-1 v2]